MMREAWSCRLARDAKGVPCLSHLPLMTDGVNVVGHLPCADPQVAALRAAGRRVAVFPRPEGDIPPLSHPWRSGITASRPPGISRRCTPRARSRSPRTRHWPVRCAPQSGGIEMDLGLSGQRVVITGGSKGIGYACAEAFAAEGCDVLIAAREPHAAAERLRAQHQVRVEALAADLSRPEERARLHATAHDADILVNNAGAIPAGHLADLSMERWAEAWQLKVFGYFHLTQLFLADMRARRAGVIVNIIGMAGRAWRASYIAGTAGNAALIAFTCAIGAEAQADGVRVFGINPAVTRTERMERQARTRAEKLLGDAARWREVIAGLPFDRPIEPREIADLAVFGASPRAGYLAGTVIDVDGGGAFRG